MRPYEPHRFEEETSVNLIPGLGPIHLPSNEICRHCGRDKGHLLHQPTWALVDQLADALEKARALILDMAYLSERQGLLLRFGCPSGALVENGAEVMVEIEAAAEAAGRLL